ncbi:hypothetical protein NQ318_006543 [Aromia moschata]|uniref:Transmembrane protein 135 N-terminal domain-containing protein n=1 Tax=Aromia moschata TaxID=1265417 RepID=A0AAV8YML5_9CUCU|nr:hypothetical protein NQ318_006543 [Aromia moschata]
MPTVISKQSFYKNIDDSIHCGDLHFWEPNCLKAVNSFFFISNMIKGSSKFFIPVYIFKLLVNYKKINDIDLWKNLLISECRSTAYGLTMGWLIVASVCSLRKLTGRLHYYNLFFFPALISGISLAIESKENQVLDTLIFFNSFIESAFYNLDYFNLFKITKTRETIIFAMISGYLMYLLENRSKKLDFLYLWFYTPPRSQSKDPESQRDCDHPSSCVNFSLEGLWKYFALGYFVNAVRSLLPKMGILARKPLGFFKILFSKANIRFGFFIGGYVGLYRILTCYLLKTNKIKKKFHGLIAGLISGLTYAISPNIQVLIVGITTLLQIFYENVSNKLGVKNHFWPRQILFMICHGALAHNKLLYPVTCSSYYSNMLNACTNGL